MVSKFLSILNDCSDKSYYAEGKYKTQVLMLTIFSLFFLYKFLYWLKYIAVIKYCNSSFFKNFKDAVCKILHSVGECEFIMHQYKIKGRGVTLWDHWVEYGCAQGKFSSVSYWGGDLKYKKRSSSISWGWSSM